MGIWCVGAKNIYYFKSGNCISVYVCVCVCVYVILLIGKLPTVAVVQHWFYKEFLVVIMSLV